ncbi:hypothetical protein FNF28_00357 [Cafeteria roenbergensis]|nr:hypothetical protein FNF28_00357 [Cafeteria roenbergensis]
MDKFGERVCRACVRETDGFRTVTKTTAKAEYLLSDSDLAVIPSELKPNPRNTRFRDMRLYLLKQLREKAYAKWGGPEGLEAEHHRRRLARVQGCAKVGHDFCDAKWDAERASSVQTCKRCGMQTEVMDF